MFAVLGGSSSVAPFFLELGHALVHTSSVLVRFSGVLVCRGCSKLCRVSRTNGVFGTRSRVLRPVCEMFQLLRKFSLAS